MKKFFSLLACALLLSAPAPRAAAQQPRPQQQPAPPPPQQPAPAPTPASQRPQPSTVANEEDEVVRITTNLVQLDAVVTDRQGRQVTDLTAEDFEVLEDGRPQKITNLSYVSNVPAAAPVSPDAARETGAAAAPAPPRRLRPEQVRRTVALVVDDLGLSFETTYFTRRALKKYVDEQMQPGDLVAIIRTSAGVGALQQFTSDRRQLYAAIERVRWYAGGRGNAGIFAPLGGELTSGAADAARRRANPESEGAAEGAAEAAAAAAELNDFRDELFAVGTLGALNFVVRGMRELPGRKSVILFSEGFSLYTPERGTSDRTLENLRRLTDLANRASIVFYAVDARGLVYTGLTAADSTAGLNPQQIEEQLSARGQRLFDTQGGLSYLAQQTGGLFIRNTNDLAGGVRRVLEDQSGYYLIGYRPERETFDRRFHRLSARVRTRPGLTVRTRRGFYGVAEENLRPAEQTAERRLLSALMSPFSASEVGVRLSAYFTADPRLTPVLTSQMILEARDLKFALAADGWHETKIEVAAVAFGDSGLAVNEHYFGQTLRLRGGAYQRALRTGIVYTFNVPVKKPGAYQLRTAVRDTATGRVGSSSQFIEVPDLKKGRLALSGVLVSGAPGGAAAAAAPAPSASVAPGSAQQRGAADAEADPETSHAVRRFRHHTYLDFAYMIFNARADRASKLPRLTARTRLYRDGRVVFEGEERPVNVGGETNSRRVLAGGRLSLGTALEPGEYVLQIIVTDALRTDRHRTAAQWIDFEVVR